MHARMSHKYLLYIAIVLLLPLQFGLHMSVLNAPMEYMGCKGVEGPREDCIEGWNPALPSSMYAIGGLCGSAITTLVTRFVGLDGALCTASLFFQVGTIVFWCAGFQGTVLVSRMITGIGAGIAIVCAPIAINQLSPPHLAAFFGAQTQISTNLGIIFAQVWGVLWAENHWRRIVAASVFVALVCLGGTVYLRARGVIAAPAALHQEGQSNAPSITLVELAKNARYRFVLVVSVALFVVQQLTGINAIILYGVRILSVVFPDYAKAVNLLISMTNLVLTLVGAYFINRYGRKRLLVISLSSMGFFTSMLAFALVRGLQGLTAAAAILTVAAFAIGIGPIPFLYISEISPPEAVNAAQSMGTVSSWLATFAVVALFPSLQGSLGSSSFYLFGVSTLASAALGAYFLQPDSSQTA